MSVHCMQDQENSNRELSRCFEKHFVIFFTDNSRSIKEHPYCTGTCSLQAKNNTSNLIDDHASLRKSVSTFQAQTVPTPYSNWEIMDDLSWPSPVINPSWYEWIYCRRSQSLKGSHYVCDSGCVRCVAFTYLACQ